MRINHGGSGSFVSPNGLVMTNHHVGAGALEKLSTKSRDLLQRASTPAPAAEELKCPDSEFDVLVSIEDVTERVNAAVKSAANSAEAEKLRRAEMNTIEQESFEQDRPAQRRDHALPRRAVPAYRYKKYTDVRLVFAPEQQIAFFGGDPDNFEYPRYDLDICFFRVYEDGKPAKTPQYLKWNPASLEAGDLVFVSGNPAHTDRMNTVRHLEFLRDCVLPDQLDMLRRREVLLMSYSQRSAEHAREAQGDAAGRSELAQGAAGRTGRPARPGRSWRLKRAEEDAFRKAAEARRTPPSAKPPLPPSTSRWPPWRRSATITRCSNRGRRSNRTLFGIARTLVRLAEETAKPNADRLRRIPRVEPADR